MDKFVKDVSSAELDMLLFVVINRVIQDERRQKNIPFTEFSFFLQCIPISGKLPTSAVRATNAGFP